MTSASISLIPETSKPFEVYCYTSNQDLVCVLIKENNVEAYNSRQLEIHKKSYPTHNLELATVVFSLKIWRHYLYGVQFTVFNYHKRPKYLLNIRQRQWVKFLKNYDFQLIYHLGKANVVVDTFSWNTIQVSIMIIRDLELIEWFKDLNLGMKLHADHIIYSQLTITNDFLRKIKEK